jgi:lipid-A-disaccharide synthase-like uncharacterized protein
MNFSELLTKYAWMIVGFAGQALFFGRFFIQWLVSEIRGESQVPLAFWFFSMAGGSVLLIYAIHLRDPVFTLGQAGGLFIYARNLTLIYRKKRQPTVSPAEDGLGKER